MGDMADYALECAFCEMLDDEKEFHEFIAVKSPLNSNRTNFGKTYAYAPSDHPLCPACDKHMVIRTNTKLNKKFWGCPSFPSCKGTRLYRDDPPPKVYITSENNTLFMLQYFGADRDGGTEPVGAPVFVWAPDMETLLRWIGSNKPNPYYGWNVTPVELLVPPDHMRLKDVLDKKMLGRGIR